LTCHDEAKAIQKRLSTETAKVVRAAAYQRVMISRKCLRRWRRALLVVGRDQDQGMPVEGSKRLEQKVKAAYARRGAADRFAVHITAGDHTYTEEMSSR
jgi:hypothetical protein